MEKKMAVVKTELGKEKDKVGIDVEVMYSPSIGGTANMTFFLKHFVNLIEREYSHPHMAGSNRSKAVYAVVDNKIVGQITFEILDDFSKTTWIVLSAVDDAYRKRGIYTILHKYLETMMLELGSRKLASHVHVDNKERQASCIKVGMKPVYYRMEKEV